MFEQTKTFRLRYRNGFDEHGPWLEKTVTHSDYIEHGKVKVSAEEWAKDEAHALAGFSDHYVIEEIPNAS